MFLKQIFLDTQIFVQSGERSDFPDPNINFLESSFIVDETHFNKIPPNSLVVLDDYTYYARQQPKIEFLKVINFTLRHKNICLFLVIHNIFHNSLFSDIIFAPHLFISYSNVGYSIMRYDLITFTFIFILYFLIFLQKNSFALRWSPCFKILC